jgi:hypothetical protein
LTVASLSSSDEAVDQTPRDGRREQRVAGRHGADRAHDVGGGRVLEQKSARAGL